MNLNIKKVCVTLDFEITAPTHLAAS